MVLRGKQSSLAQLGLVVAPAFVLFGYNQAGIGGLLSVKDWTETFPEIDTVHVTGAVKMQHSLVQGTTVATFVLGALVGALSCIFTGDIFGRRKLIFGGALLTFVGEALCCTSFGLAQFIVGRTIIGMGVGILSATVPVWQAECSDAKHRGKHVVLDGLFISFGYVLESWINLGFFQIKTGSVSWRLPLALPTVVSLLLMASIFSMPESPRWLVRVGKTDEARRNLAILNDVEETSAVVNLAIAGIEHNVEEMKEQGLGLKDCFKSGPDKLFYRFTLCILLQFYQQMSGSNLISVYAPIIFQEGLKLDSQTSRILSAGALTWKFLSCFVAFFTIDRFGRRALFLVSGIGMGCCMLSLAIATSMPEDNKAASIASVFFIFMFNFFVPIGFLGANFLYCAEIAPLSLRVAMSSVSTANHWLWNFVVAMVTPTAINELGYKYYILYCVISFCIPLSVFFFYPETMGQSLEQIDSMFKDNDSIFAVVKQSIKQSKRTPNIPVDEKGDIIASHAEKVDAEKGMSSASDSDEISAKE
ncbi:hypothetical protein HYALB_00007958 [Hymenoscyphus albidus]|uniref:Major facilitator superfamily (MFS) profile domain-containing protein n=1 Tax=Hymenoscyphus albidus TaxID=595503 RepID=A0A9N9LK83_9HELO|nr:hypothetical protein HYALB_00007958 [Hymenoscyphus albidus]